MIDIGGITLTDGGVNEVLNETGVRFETDDAVLQRLFDAAEGKCGRNIRMFGGRKVLVEGGGYEKAWLETQPMGGGMYAKRDLTAALNNQLIFIDGQRADGRMPGSLQCMPDGTVEPQYNKLQGFCFPEHALDVWYLTGRDPAYLDALADCLRRFDEYLQRTRDSDGDGLLESWCVYDTGEDNALRYGKAPVYWTEDAPPVNADTVPMASMDVTSYSYACRETLRQISLLRGNAADAETWRVKACETAALLKKGLWDERRSACYDRDRTGRVIDVLCHNNLRCMYWGSFSQEMADRFVSEHLLNENEFLTPLPLPSVAVNDPMFRNIPANNWSGQCEGLTYQRAIPALERYGYEKTVTYLGHRLLDTVVRNGYLFTQQYDPFTGAASRVGMYSHDVTAADADEPVQDAYGPTVLACLEYISHIWGVELKRDEVWFSAGKGMPYTYEQRFGEKTYGIVSDGRGAELFFGRKRICRVTCGCRIICDRNGEILRSVGIED
ncbi:MAG: hypothetical protein MJ142_03185 [Clostridia bacterium]|nr:hypothetical protein [Clostridia bacterium]